MLLLTVQSSMENAQATNADDTDSCCRLLECPDLPLSLIWQHVCKLPMHERYALLITCKRALSTFGGLIDRMERLRLKLGWTPWGHKGMVPVIQHEHEHGSAVHPQHGGYSGHALRVLSWFPGARIARLELHFPADYKGSPSLRSFAAGARMWLMHVTSLKLHALVGEGTIQTFS